MASSLVGVVSVEVVLIFLTTFAFIGASNPRAPARIQWVRWSARGLMVITFFWSVIAGVLWELGALASSI